MNQIEDLKETAPCGMVIHYTVDGNDFVVYNDINGRGVKCDSCKHCSWKAICTPVEFTVMNFEQLIERMNTVKSIRETGCVYVFKEWYATISGIDSDQPYRKLCGVFYGLYALGFINEQELKELRDELLNKYLKREGN